MNDKRKATLIKCPNRECEYKWWYKGSLIVYATCPSCRRNIKVLQNKIETLQPVSQVGTLVQTATAENPPAGADEQRQ